MKTLELINICKTYAEKGLFGRNVRTNEAVKNVSLLLEEGKCLGLVGESGCGKSTLGRIICGLEKPTAGEVDINGITNMVFQDSFSAVDPRYTAAEIIREPIRNYLNMVREEEDALIERLLLTVGLHREDAGKRPHQFSGGQLQRVCLARAIAVKPKLIVLDEPTSSLDVSVQAQILNLLADLKKEFNLTYVFISHDLEAVYYLADALAVMYMGTVVEYIEDISLFHHLSHPYTKKLLTSVLGTGENRNKPLGKIAYDEPVFPKIGYAGCLYAPRCSISEPVCFQDQPVLYGIGEGHLAACHKSQKLTGEQIAL